MCTADGTWFRHPHSNRTWSNYTNCVNWDHVNIINNINTVNIIILIISIIALLVSLIIFSVLREIFCSRVLVHMNLFLALLLNNISWLLVYSIVYNIDDHVDDPLLCRVLYCLTMFFMMSTYFWALCEAIFLWVLVKTWVLPHHVVRHLSVLGWSGPLLCVVPHILYKYFEENELCWMEKGDSNHILVIPTAIIMIINLVVMVMVVRTIKNRPQVQSSAESIKLKNYLKMISILMPIFGLHFLLLPVRPETGSSYEFLYELLSSVNTSSQGIMVSVLLCFTNHDVITSIKKRIRRHQQNSPTNTHIQLQALSVQRNSKSEEVVELNQNTEC